MAISWDVLCRPAISFSIIDRFIELQCLLAAIGGTSKLAIAGDRLGVDHLMGLPVPLAKISHPFQKTSIFDRCSIIFQLV
jgi:hypothetical protein